MGQPAEGGADKVRVSGRGLEYGEVNELNEFSIYTHEAGAGGLSIAIEGPSKAEISFKVSLHHLSRILSAGVEIRPLNKLLTPGVFCLQTGTDFCGPISHFSVYH